MSQAELTYVVDGEWDDAEWRAAAAKGAAARTAEEQELYRRGPRKHPWDGLNTCSLVVPDKAKRIERVLIFPNKACADAFAKANARPPRRNAPNA